MGANAFSMAAVSLILLAAAAARKVKFVMHRPVFVFAT
jgi:hypothetical protein